MPFRSVSVVDRPTPRCTFAFATLAVASVIASFTSGCAPRRPAVDWTGLETTASAKVQSRPSEGSYAVERIDTGEPYEVHHRFKVEGGNCYDAAFAWGFEKQVSVSVIYALDGAKPINTHVRKITAPPIGPRSGGVSFCVDESGEVGLKLRPVDDRTSTGPAGRALDQKPRYALAVAYRKETDDQRAARHAEEDKEAGAQHEDFVAESKEREADRLRERQNKACRSCRAEHRTCKTRTRTVSICDRDYDRCLKNSSVDPTACAALPD